ncbi:hypothetical protein GPECTOR_96g714 [Gonium pectorale]|uniref:Uncharacterized protein n=1 Tax=Gonium pectorale TaxID=33097 RepID=A0A150G090_GONPE|nr:hypothetical protein GPECTOR_96g714 [Gonium pectorale]|eukprot:KXZ43248.1 hypothetical protein GPECTOR_96g714 [Gonium pectorale]
MFQPVTRKQCQQPTVPATQSPPNEVIALTAAVACERRTRLAAEKRLSQAEGRFDDLTRQLEEARQQAERMAETARQYEARAHKAEQELAAALADRNWFCAEGHAARMLLETGRDAAALGEQLAACRLQAQAQAIDNDALRTHLRQLQSAFDARLQAAAAREAQLSEQLAMARTAARASAAQEAAAASAAAAARMKVLEDELDFMSCSLDIKDQRVKNIELEAMRLAAALDDSNRRVAELLEAGLTAATSAGSAPSAAALFDAAAGSSRMMDLANGADLGGGALFGGFGGFAPLPCSQDGCAAQQLPAAVASAWSSRTSSARSLTALGMGLGAATPFLAFPAPVLGVGASDAEQTDSSSDGGSKRGTEAGEATGYGTL